MDVPYDLGFWLDFDCIDRSRRLYKFVKEFRVLILDDLPELDVFFDQAFYLQID